MVKFDTLGPLLTMYLQQGLGYSALRHIFSKIKGVMLKLTKMASCSIFQGLMQGKEWYKDTGNDPIFLYNILNILREGVILIHQLRLL